MSDSPSETQAEEFATWFENSIRPLGVTGEYFCEAQHDRWRQHAVRAFLGESPDANKEAANPSFEATFFPPAPKL